VDILLIIKLLTKKQKNVINRRPGGMNDKNSHLSQNSEDGKGMGGVLCFQKNKKKSIADNNNGCPLFIFLSEF
jgi:hypothetical protein